MESFWESASVALHTDPDQVKRQKSATQIYLDPANMDRAEAVARIKDYAVSLGSCTCVDFSRRGLPCKHMYRLAHELDIFDIGSVPSEVPPILEKKPGRVETASKTISTYWGQDEQGNEIWKEERLDDEETIEITITADIEGIVARALDRHGEKHPLQLELPDGSLVLGAVPECPPQIQFFDGFSWAIPRAFEAAIASCRFERGDVLYDTRMAYGQKTWADCLPHIRYSIQVRTPDRGSVSLPHSSADSEASFRENWQHTVSFELTDHRLNERRIIWSTQGHLYTTVLTGQLDWIMDRSLVPPIPLLASDFARCLKCSNFAEAARSNLHVGNAVGPYATFLMAYDDTALRSRNKLRDIIHALDTKFSYRTIDMYPDVEARLPYARCIPTARIVRIDIMEAEYIEVFHTLKNVLYRPQDKNVSAEKFSMKAHGYLWAYGPDGVVDSHICPHPALARTG